MKSIAVFTDCSTASTHAALYALHLAKKMKTDIILYPIDPLPVSRQLVMVSASGEEEGQDSRSVIPERLDPFSRQLKSQFLEGSSLMGNMPAISYYTDSEEVVDVMTSVVNNNDIILIVMAPRDGEDIATCMFGEPYRQVSDWAPVPVMVVPCTANIRNPEKIAITTSLAEHDTDYINVLVNLMEPFSPEIMVSHLSEGPAADNALINEEKNLQANIYKYIDYGRIYYRRISSCKLEKGWQWLSDNKKCDMLVMKHKPQNQLRDFFKLGSTPHITSHITIPVLIIPAVN